MGAEKKLREQAKRLVQSHGGLLLPLRGWLVGTPDALLIHAGHLELIEFKAPSETLSPAQQVMAKRVKNAGSTVYVVDNLEILKKLLEEPTDKKAKEIYMLEHGSDLKQ